MLRPDRRVLFANASAEQLDAPHLRDVLAQAALGTASRTGLWFTPSLATGWLHAAPLAPAIAHASDWPTPGVLLTEHLDQPALDGQRCCAAALRDGAATG